MSHSVLLPLFLLKIELCPHLGSYLHFMHTPYGVLTGISAGLASPLDSLIPESLVLSADLVNVKA